MSRRSYSPRGYSRDRSPPRRGYRSRSRDRYHSRRSPARYESRRYDDRYDDRYDRRGGGYRDYGRDRYERRDRYDRRDDYRSSRRGRSYDRGSNYNRRGRNDSPELEEFRHVSMSRSPPREGDSDQSTARVKLKEEEVAYVFGRMGTTKDKLARVSGAKIDLVGPELVINGPKVACKRASSYVQILLDQRHGAVTIDIENHAHDLTLVAVPTSCKGFITGKGGATLRQIEREHATLMTFCKRTDDSDEPLAIFGSRRGRLGAQLKVMSIVEGKNDGYYSKHGSEPIVESLDEPDPNWGVRFEPLPRDMLGFVLGAKGATRQKLEISSGCVIQYIGSWVAFGGTTSDQNRGYDYFSWLLDSRTEKKCISST
eukprot:UN32984